MDTSHNSTFSADSIILNRVLQLDRVTNSNFDIDLKMGDYDITQGGRYDFNSQILSKINVTIDDVSSTGGKMLKPYTIASGTAEGQNVIHNGVLLPWLLAEIPPREADGQHSPIMKASNLRLCCASCLREESLSSVHDAGRPN